MLGGTLPFDDDDKEIQFKNIVTGKFDISTEVWTHTSNEAKEFLQLLLEKDRKRRTNIPDLLKHPWLTKYVEID